eukprot:TRINITY_DN5736_c0_g1_i1.p1 TRINITY_DN5736_c0_g1~~TRINITY_DN5736_c0_g1_i1.p1  ORF type:complete len:627 (+),score=192.75 TRINITY_DN5736_c0_g1_i1:77-1882(+)
MGCGASSKYEAPPDGKDAAGASKAPSPGASGGPSGTVATAPPPAEVDAMPATLEKAPAGEETAEDKLERKISKEITASTAGALHSASMRAKEMGQYIIDTTLPVTDYYTIDKSSKAKLYDGPYGPIRRVVNQTTQRERVMKAYRKKNVKSTWFQEHLTVMRKLDHPNICRLFEVFSDRLNFYVVVNLCSGGHVVNAVAQLEDFDEPDAARIVRQVLMAVAYMNERRVCHRNLCPDNLMIAESVKDHTQMQLQVIDFGHSTRYKEGEKMTQLVGLPDIMAPQVVRKSYTEACDVWSIGVILYSLLCGSPPFYGETDEDVMKQVKAGKVHWDEETWDVFTPEARELARGLLTYEEDQRIKPAEALQSAWIARTTASDRKKLKLKASHLESLRKFGKRNMLEKAVINTVALRMQDSEIVQLREIFQSIDVDSSGTITLEELQKGIVDHLGSMDGLGDLKKIVDALDVNGSRQIDYTEFLAAMLDRRYYHEEGVLWTAFRYFDKDGNGEIDDNELASVLADESLEELASKQQISQVMKDCDFNGDGKIDFDEFVCMMRGVKYTQGMGGKFSKMGRTEDGRLIFDRDPKKDKDAMSSYRKGGVFKA